MVPSVAPEVMRFYASTIDESQRLSATAEGVLELVRTQELLRRYLPAPPAHVLDVGGGPGAHARWLVADGYQVTLVDPVPRHVEQAGRIPGCVAEIGDARALGAETSSCDVVLLLGPLYHLQQRQDRDRALAEACRVVRPGGLVAAAGINRYSSLFEHAAFAHLHHERLHDSVSTILESQVHDGRRGFTAAYFHSGEELRQEMTAAGLEGVEVLGVEGPAWSMLAAAERNTDRSFRASPLFESALAAARMAEPYPELLAAGSHLLAVGRRPA
ncbi:class I SAM-dependent methyltransferase [Streptomyces sp. NPDC059740]|uniref:class I SAM-dependent methyltransferase n=1 Tax=Streptomyces sp. NPDC059740 TaxID=3346926 RepID=UPI003659A9B8